MGMVVYEFKTHKGKYQVFRNDHMIGWISCEDGVWGFKNIFGAEPLESGKDVVEIIKQIKRMYV